jgi:hypothetical protein
VLSTLVFARAWKGMRGARLDEMRMLITCPETATLEKVEYDVHPLGRLILACSRFKDCPIRCSRHCAAQLDREDRERTDPEIICASADRTGPFRTVR